MLAKWGSDFIFFPREKNKTLGCTNLAVFIFCVQNKCRYHIEMVTGNQGYSWKKFLLLVEPYVLEIRACSSSRSKSQLEEEKISNCSEIKLLGYQFKQLFQITSARFEFLSSKSWYMSWSAPEFLGEQRRKLSDYEQRDRLRSCHPCLRGYGDWRPQYLL